MSYTLPGVAVQSDYSTENPNIRLVEVLVFEPPFVEPPGPTTTTTSTTTVAPPNPPVAISVVPSSSNARLTWTRNETDTYGATGNFLIYKDTGGNLAYTLVHSDTRANLVVSGSFAWNDPSPVNNANYYVVFQNVGNTVTSLPSNIVQYSSPTTTTTSSSTSTTTAAPVPAAPVITSVTHVTGTNMLTANFTWAGGTFAGTGQIFMEAELLDIDHTTVVHTYYTDIAAPIASAASGSIGDVAPPATSGQFWRVRLRWASNTRTSAYSATYDVVVGTPIITSLLMPSVGTKLQGNTFSYTVSILDQGGNVMTSANNPIKLIGIVGLLPGGAALNGLISTATAGVVTFEGLYFTNAVGGSGAHLHAVVMDVPSVTGDSNGFTITAAGTTTSVPIPNTPTDFVANNFGGNDVALFWRWSDVIYGLTGNFWIYKDAGPTGDFELITVVTYEDADQGENEFVLIDTSPESADYYIVYKDATNTYASDPTDIVSYVDGSPGTLPNAPVITGVPYFSPNAIVQWSWSDATYGEAGTFLIFRSTDAGSASLLTTTTYDESFLGHNFSILDSTPVAGHTYHYHVIYKTVDNSLASVSSNTLSVSV